MKYLLVYKLCQRKSLQKSLRKMNYGIQRTNESSLENVSRVGWSLQRLAMCVEWWVKWVENFHKFLQQNATNISVMIPPSNNHQSAP